MKVQDVYLLLRTICFGWLPALKARCMQVVVDLILFAMPSQHGTSRPVSTLTSGPVKRLGQFRIPNEVVKKVRTKEMVIQCAEDRANLDCLKKMVVERADDRAPENDQDSDLKPGKEQDDSEPHVDVEENFDIQDSQL